MDPKNNPEHTSEWVRQRLAGLALPTGWEPDTGEALETFRQRVPAREAGWPAWMWAGATAAVLFLSVLAVPASRTAAEAAWQRIAGGLPAPETAPGAQRAAVFDDIGRLQFPSGYRNWVYVGTSLGLNYSEGPEAFGESWRGELFQNVYIDPAAYAQYRETGQFPEGTVMILEVASSEVRNEPGLQGRYEKEILGIEASVKDSRRFEEGWAYFSFRDRSGRTPQTAEAFPEDSCWTCHHDHAETDHVFTQFYPVLSLVLF
jgi:hypothetical protein